jgi:L-lactate utilization protein LutC
METNGLRNRTAVMNGEREKFLKRVREAVAQGNMAGAAVAPGPRNGVGYQGAGKDPVHRFGQELAAAGGQFHVVRDAKSATSCVTGLVRARNAKRVLLGGGTLVASLGLADELTERGVIVEKIHVDEKKLREAAFAADIGVGGVDYLIAETGSVVVLSGPDQPRSLSLLPPVHVAVAHRDQLLPDLFDLFDRTIAATNRPACLALITGPSKTGDIELRLVTGVHGPGEIHVVLIVPDGNFGPGFTNY